MIIMAFCTALTNTSFIMRDDVRSLLATCAGGALLFSVLFSYTHTLWSYRFAYMQGLTFVKKHAWELIGYPFLIIFCLAAAAYSWDKPVASIAGVSEIEKVFSMCGIALNWSKYDSLGEMLLALMLVLQIVMSGYHYGMQAMGIAIACGDKHGYKLTPAQKKYLRLNILALWLVNLLSGYTFLSLLDSQCFAYKPVHFPFQWQAASGILLLSSVLLIVFKIILPIYRAEGRLPPLSSCTTFLSVWLWLQPYFQPYGFQISVVPLAHGLQYLYFSGRAESRGFADTSDTLKCQSQRTAFLFLGFIFLVLASGGYFFYKLLPVMLDSNTVINHMSPNFFIIAAYIFLNTHHYMIDSVIWKGDSRLRPLISKLPAA